MYRDEYICMRVHMDVLSCDCIMDEYSFMSPIVCFCYRSRERSQEETAGQAELTLEHVPWETCALS